VLIHAEEYKRSLKAKRKSPSQKTTTIKIPIGKAFVIAEATAFEVK
jgi:hypothetical protein